MVTCRAKEAIGLPYGSLDIKVGDPADLVIFESPANGNAPSNIQNAVFMPDSAKIKRVLYKGALTS